MNVLYVSMNVNIKEAIPQIIMFTIKYYKRSIKIHTYT